MYQAKQKVVAFVLIQVLSIAYWSTSVSAQCAMCRASVESTISNGRSNLAEGLNTGILYLLLAPYLCFVVIGWLWYKNSKLQTSKKQMLTDRINAIIKKS